MASADIGVIGGSGLYELEGMEHLEDVDIDTPFGRPSDVITVGLLGDRRVAFLPRHGRGHRLLPSEVPYRANVFALKLLGVTTIISASAVGSLREDYQPMDMVIPDQVFDRTKSRQSTFFGDGIVGHVGFAHPFCLRTSQQVEVSARSVVPRTHSGGTYVCMEGPQFSTFAESTTYRALGFDIIGMTALPEAKLAREAEICYAVLAQVTDYDCWYPGHDTVTSDMVMENVAANVANARAILRHLILELEESEDCTCRYALSGAIVTDPSTVPERTRARLEPLLGGHPVLERE